MEFTLEEVQPSELRSIARRGGGKSAALVDQFLKSGMYTARIKPVPNNGEVTADFAERMANTVGLYCRKHKLPVKPVKRGDEVFLKRTDLLEPTGEQAAAS